MPMTPNNQESLLCWRTTGVGRLNEFQRSVGQRPELHETRILSVGLLLLVCVRVDVKHLGAEDAKILLIGRLFFHYFPGVCFQWLQFG